MASGCSIKTLKLRLQSSYLRRRTLVMVVRFSPLFVCLFVGTISQKTDAARITKLDKQMFHDESRLSIYFWVKG